MAGRIRLIHLDVMRGIAILMVMGPHMPRESPDMSEALKVWHRGGWCGVDLFFVLSGFLIGGLLFDEYLDTGAIRFGRFVIRRGFKIWPSYVAFLIFGFITLAGEQPGNIARASMGTLVDIWPNLLQVQNYFAGPFPHTWSLAVEEHFYLLLPLVLMGMIAQNRRHSGGDAFRWLPGLVLGVALICMGARIMTAALIRPFNLYIHFFPTHLRIDSLLFGVLLAYIVRFRAKWVDWLRPFTALVFLASTAIFLPPFLFDLGNTPWLFAAWPAALAVGSGGFVLLAWFSSRQNPRSKNPLVRILAGIGVYSYSIYLWHVALAQMISHQIPARGPRWGIAPVALGYVVLAITIGALVFWLIEQPMLAIRNRIFPSPSDTPLAVGSVRA